MYHPRERVYSEPGKNACAANPRPFANLVRHDRTLSRYMGMSQNLLIMWYKGWPSTLRFTGGTGFWPTSIYIIAGWWFGTCYIFHNIWDSPSHWLIFFKVVKTTNQYLSLIDTNKTIASMDNRYGFTRNWSINDGFCPFFWWIKLRIQLEMSLVQHRVCHGGRKSIFH